MIKKYNPLSKIIMLAGLFFTITAIAKYYWIFPDLDRLIAYTSIGILWIIIGYFHDRIRRLNITLDSVEQYLADKNYEETEQ